MRLVELVNLELAVLLLFNPLYKLLIDLLDQYIKFYLF